MVILEAQQLVKRFGKVVALDDLSLSVNEGDVMGLIGPNGAGKTTTIKIALGLLRPNHGRVRLFGEDPWDNPGIRRRVGVVFEKANFPPHHSVSDYLERVAGIFGLPRTRVHEVLRQVSLEQAADRQIKGLSAGMLQKFAIAHALIHDPELIVADEPTANLDPQARSEILDLVIRLNTDNGVTFLISSHILPELSRVCRSASVISAGKIWASGGLTELFEKFATNVFRVATDSPQQLASLLHELTYLEHVDIGPQELLVKVERDKANQLHQDIPRLASEAGIRVFGIESRSASLEELFRQAVKSTGRAG